jgi:hypothetical protein
VVLFLVARNTLLKNFQNYCLEKQRSHSSKGQYQLRELSLFKAGPDRTEVNAQLSLIILGKEEKM